MSIIMPIPTWFEDLDGHVEQRGEQDQQLHAVPVVGDGAVGVPHEAARVAPPLPAQALQAADEDGAAVVPLARQRHAPERAQLRATHK